MEDIHSAFRKLARELHPDITGSKSDFRFKQITGAYSFLKNLSESELADLAGKTPERVIKQENNSVKINAILDKYSDEINNYYENHSSNNGVDLQNILFRLKSGNHKIINIALRHSGRFANKIEFRRALCDVLKRSDLDDETARLAASLPFDDNTRKQLALDLADKSGKFPAGLIISLMANDIDLMEKFLLFSSADNIAVILRRWPAGKSISSSVVRQLLNSDDEKILIPLLSAAKMKFPGVLLAHKRRLAILENHPSAAVRAWAKNFI
ncbi:MAG: DnaJ domain-containing protein [Synergistaceae bacterium]|nr:DnaJ domain-containing protein [Synergistaceae bacterium]